MIKKSNKIKNANFGLKKRTLLKYSIFEVIYKKKIFTEYMY
jgi:hypothetical protein